jgi:predicted nucleotide-binding protein (sugar kinase/HSP70/actin superfamily)
MTKKVGIPRGLFFYQYYPLWKTFFEELGAEITVSDYTNKKILDDGVKTCIDEACLAVKIFYGHVINLKDKVDCIFIPRFTSISKNEYICPKFGSLPVQKRAGACGAHSVHCKVIYYASS